MNRRQMLAYAAGLPLLAMGTRAVAQTVLGDLERLRADLASALGSRLVMADGRTWSRAARTAVAQVQASLPPSRLVTVVDRNPAVQQLMIMLATPDGDWPLLGGCLVSTGRPGGRDHFKTPLGAFQNSADILGFRAQGTKNANGIRGYGIKGMRVWDFGWQDAEHANGRINPGGMRLCMHATDPDRLERVLGKPASEGCVRLPAVMNRFLDLNGIIDMDIEQAAQSDRRFAALLKPERTPTPLAGNHLVVFES